VAYEHCNGTQKKASGSGESCIVSGGPLTKILGRGDVKAKIKKGVPKLSKNCSKEKTGASGLNLEYRANRDEGIQGGF